MGNHFTTYLRQNPHLTVVDTTTPEGIILMWALGERYIDMTQFEGRYLYTQMDLKKARMWKEKVGQDSTSTQD